MLSVTAVEDEYLRAIRDDPGNDGAWTAYADWLAGRYDSRAEVLRILLVAGVPENVRHYPDLDARLSRLTKGVSTLWLDRVIRTRAVLGGGRPDPADITALWQEIQVTPAPVGTERYRQAVADLREAFGRCYVNGGALFGRFALTPHPMLTWYGTRGRWADVEFFGRLVRSPAVRGAVRDLSRRAARHGGDFDRAVAQDTCHYGSASVLAQQVEGALLKGGAYTEFTGKGYRGTGRDRPIDVRSVVTRCCPVLIGSHPAEVDICHCTAAWAPWFGNVAWDHSWAVIDRHDWSVGLVCASDSD